MKPQIIDISGLTEHCLILFDQMLVVPHDVEKALEAALLKCDTAVTVGFVPIRFAPPRNPVQLLTEPQLNELGWYRKDEE